MSRQVFSLLRTAAPLVALALLAATAATAAAQGFIVDHRSDRHWRMPRPIPLPRPVRPEATYRIAELEINAKLDDTVAKVQVAQTFENEGHGTIEASFIFPLPYDGAIDQLTLLVDGKEYPAKLLGAKEAREKYEAIVRQSRDPALLEWVGNGMFQTSVFPIPAGAKRVVTLRYTQLLRKSGGLSDFLFPLSTAKYTSRELDRLKIRVAIESPTDIKTVYSPTHSVNVDRPDDKHAVVELEQKDCFVAEDFRLFTSSEDGPVAASVVSYRPDEDEDGYFLLLASPEISPADEKRQAKTVVFVVDRSGSMSGEKMEQARQAVKFVLNNLREGDTFNIVAYDSEVETFRPELEKFNEETREQALGFVNGLFAGGTTNIDGALSRAFEMLRDDDRPSYLLFMTDGLPTFGETNETKIVENAERANRVRARLFSFGVGYDLNSRLLDKLARSGHGITEFVRPNEDIEAAVSSFYKRIEAPVLVDVSLKVEVEGSRTADGDAVNRIYPGGKFDLFAGDQAVIVGRYRTSGSAKVTLRGSVNGKEESIAYPAELARETDDDTNAFVGRLWATRRVGEIIDELDLRGKNDELIEELVDLAKKHGILTPYTSFMADDSVNVRDRGQLRANAADRLEDLAQTEGEFGVNQRGGNRLLRSANEPASGGFGFDGDASGRGRGGQAGQQQAGGGGFGGGGGGFGGGRGGGGGFGGRASFGGAVAGGERAELARRGGRGVTYYDAKDNQQRLAENVITAGRKTFFNRGGRWVDSTVTEEEEKSARSIERFSDEYFELLTRYGKQAAAYMSVEEPVTVKLGGEVYAW
jgi:uncharacterized protein YegL